MIKLAKLLAEALESNDWKVEEDNASANTFFIGKKVVQLGQKTKLAQSYIEVFGEQIRLSGYHWNEAHDLLNLKSKKFFDPKDYDIESIKTNVQAFMVEVS